MRERERRQNFERIEARPGPKLASVDFFARAESRLDAIGQSATEKKKEKSFRGAKIRVEKRPDRFDGLGAI